MYKLEYPELNKYLDDFLRYLRDIEKLNEKTAQLHKRIVVYFLNFIGEAKKTSLLEVTEQDVINFIGSLKMFSASTKTASCYTMRKFLNYHYKSDNLLFSGHKVFPYIHSNYANHIISFYNPEELSDVLNSFDLSNKNELRDYVIVLLIIETGIRESDVANLRLSSINWDQKSITVRQLKTEKILKNTISDQLMFSLIEYLKNRKPCITGDDYVFYTHDGMKPLQSKLIYSIVKKYLIRSGIDFRGRKKGPHALRSSLATNMLAHNTPVPIIQTVLGHEKVKTTLGYIRVDLNQLIKVALEVPTYERKN